MKKRTHLIIIVLVALISSPGLAYESNRLRKNGGSRRIPPLPNGIGNLARRGEAILGEANEYGQKYSISGTLIGPGGVGLEVTTVWILPTPDAPPRLVTVFPR